MICGKCVHAKGRPAEDWDYCFRHKKITQVTSTCPEYVSSRVIMKSGMRAPRYRIVNLFGALNRIELFCRFPEPGWDHWGNEVDSEIIIK